FFIPDFKALLVKPHLPPVLGGNAHGHELIPGDCESALVASVAGPRPKRQLSRNFVRQTPIPEPPLDEPANQRCVHGLGSDDSSVHPRPSRRDHPMMDRRAFITVVGGSILAGPRAAKAQQAAKIARIGYLAGNLASGPQFPEAFRQGLRDLGYVEGRNMVIEYGDAEGKAERFPALAAELVARKVDVILAPGTEHALAAKQATKTIPIVFADISDPELRGLVTSLARPGGNITGLSNLQPELIGKGLELLKQTVPGVNHVAFRWQRDVLPEPAQRDILQRAQVAAKAARVRLQFVDVRGSEGPDRAFSDMTRARIDAVIVWGGATFISERQRIAELAAK